MNKRFVRRKAEPADLFAMCVFASLLPEMTENGGYAASKWIVEIVNSKTDWQPATTFAPREEK